MFFTLKKSQIQCWTSNDLRLPCLLMFRGKIGGKVGYGDGFQVDCVIIDVY